MNSKTCPACNTTNNPSFNSCWHCGQSLDLKNATTMPIIIKKEAYDIFKLSKFSYILSRDNLKTGLYFLPWVFVSSLLSYFVSIISPNSKILELVVLLGPATLVLGWCIRYLLPTYSNLKWELSENFFIAGLKTHLYALLPVLILGVKLALIFLPAYLLFKFTKLSAPINSILDMPLFRVLSIVVLFAIRSVLAMAAYAAVVRYLFEKRANLSMN